MEFEEQIKEAEVVIDTTPTVYLRWKNTEEGRDKTDCYQRIEYGQVCVYINTNNRSMSVIRGDAFWDKLEKLYHSLKQPKK